MSTEPRYFRMIRLIPPFLEGGRISVQNHGLKGKMTKNHFLRRIFDRPPGIPGMLLKFAYPLRFIASSKFEIALWWKSTAEAEVVCQFFSFIAFSLFVLSIYQYQCLCEV